MLFLSCFSDDSCTESVLVNMNYVRRFIKNDEENPVADTIVEVRKFPLESSNCNEAEFYYLDADIVENYDDLMTYLLYIPER